MVLSAFMKLNHIGIAASSPESFKKLLHLLGLSVNHTEDVPEQGVRTHFVSLQNQSPQDAPSLEFLEPVDPEGVIAKYIAKRGQGIHHLSFTIPTGTPGGLEGLCGRLKDHGIKLIYDKPKKGAHQMNINFIHPASASGILIELMEPADGN